LRRTWKRGDGGGEGGVEGIIARLWWLKKREGGESERGES